MKLLTIDSHSWHQGVEQLMSSHRVYGPAKDEDFHNFKLLEQGRRPDFQFQNTRLSPKSLIFPQSQKMFTFSLDESDPEHHVLQEVPQENMPRVVLGIRPCDAYSFLLVRKNFDTSEYKDPYWLRAYEATSFVGLACSEPCSSCFCTTAGCGPHHEEGLDLLLVENDGGFLLKVLTAKGEQICAAAGWQSEADAATIQAKLGQLKAAAEDKITAAVTTDNLKGYSLQTLYDAPFWEEVAFSCINCGTCTYLCPTCWCFDIQDESYRKSGIRMRNWDSCMYPLFTLHGSGHNPRGQKVQRVRQRFMHKLKYYVDKYDSGIQCVGCGRCVRYCPVNIDIRRVCDLMNSFDPEACACPV